MSGTTAFADVPEGRLALDGPAHDAFCAELARCAADRVAERIWRGDHTLWKPEPAQIADRLGWLRAPGAMGAEIARIGAFVEDVRREEITEVLLLGMGGSSLAAELFASTFDSAPGHPRLTVLDSTDPGAVRAAERRCDPRSTLHLVSTKSGGTVETISFFKYFFGRTVERLGRDRAGRRFAVVTDPGSSLEALSRELGVRAVFLNDPEVGGRFSALTCFGLLPAALTGVDLGRLLDRAQAMARRCGPGVAAGANPGIALGSLAGALAQSGRDKLTLVCSTQIAGFGSWVEQLVAESTGKDGRGILPVDGEDFAPGRRFGADRLFVFLLLEDDRAHDAALARLAAGGQPVLELRIGEPYDLGGEFFRWEFATAVLGRALGVNPFDQPDVESAKLQAGCALATYREQGTLPPPAGAVSGAAAAAAIGRLLERARPGDYVAVQAFADPSDLGEELGALAAALRGRTDLALTVGFGPRFLHSTGQFHKGGPAGGIYIQLVTANPADLPIPDDFGGRAGAVGFGVLKAAQALGDLRALEAAGRRVLRVNLGDAGPAVAGRVRALARALDRTT